MANPFEDPDASYRVLVNHEGQHSLWPAAQPVPDGWTVAHDTDSRPACLEYIETNWTDMRPKSLIQAQGELGTLLLPNGPGGSACAAPTAWPIGMRNHHGRTPSARLVQPGGGARH